MARTGRVKMEAEELAWFCEQIALVQKSGIGIQDGVALLVDSTDDTRQQDILKKLDHELKAMVPLSAAMKSAGGFPAYLVHMSEIGELSGNLDSVMTNLSDFYQRDAELRRRVRSALIYPLVLLVMMAAVIVLLIARVLPVFNEILSAFGASMPPVSLALMNAGLFIGRNIWWLVPLAIFLIVIVMIWVRKGRGRVWLEKFKTNAPFVGSIYKQIYAARFSLALSYLISSGIDLDTSLNMTEDMLDNQLIRDRIVDCRAQINQGRDPFDALQETDLFPKIFAKMLSLGSRTGNLDQVMAKIARTYESDVRHKLSRLTSLVEPVLVIILSLIVAVILLTVMLPLINIMSSVG